MVIEITKAVLEELYSLNRSEFEKLAYLISKNIGENIFASKSTQNFIYLNLQTCLFLIKNYEAKELQIYYDNLHDILSSVSKLKRIVIVPQNKSTKEIEVEYDYDFVTELLIKPIKIILENINDKKIYDIIIREYIKDNNGLAVNLDYQNGNGNQTAKTLERNIEEKKISLIITDCDKKYLGEENGSSTPAKVKKVIDQKKFFCEHIVINYKNVEGLIPYRFVIDNLDSKIKISFDKVYKKSEDKEWLNFFDFKKGIKKNLRSESSGGIVSSSVEWWNSKLKLEVCILKFIETVSEIDIFKTGVPVSLMEKPMNGIIFRDKSSEEQKKEYRRISNTVYPWVVSNDYVIT